MTTVVVDAAMLTYGHPAGPAHLRCGASTPDAGSPEVPFAQARPHSWPITRVVPPHVTVCTSGHGGNCSA